MMRMIEMLMSVFRQHASDDFTVPVEKRRCVWDLENEG